MTPKDLLSNLPLEWALLLSPVSNTEKFKNLDSFISKSKNPVFPPVSNVFAAYQDNLINQIKVVIVGQDPYHGPNQAHGLSFSVKKGNRQPPSLKNMFKELESDLGIAPPENFMGELTHWSKQGVFLINSVLTVEKGKPNSHKNIGWEEFTDLTIQLISENSQNVVFVLWGKFAQKKEGLINTEKHFILKSAHPSPFSARNGFFGSKPYSRINEFLNKTNQNEIDWQIK